MSIKFANYFKSLNLNQRKELASSCKTSVEYLAKQVSLIRNNKAASIFKPSICTSIEVFSKGEVTRKDLRPNDWHEIWIELRDPLTT